VDGGGDAVAVPLPPQAATLSAVSGITTALARKVMGLRVMFRSFGWEHRQSQRPAGIESANA
jgi:hypothetical protein